MTGFHDTTVTILKHVLDEQTQDLTRFEHRLERADAGASPAAVQSFRNQVAELTAVAGDFRRLVTLVQAANAADAAGLPAVLTLDTRAKTPEPQPNPARENLIVATRRVQIALRELQQELAAANTAAAGAVPEGDLVSQLDAVAAVWSDAMFEDNEDGDPCGGLTNADVLSADELYEDERALEAHLDAIDEERYAEENAATRYDDEYFDVDDEDEDGGEDL